MKFVGSLLGISLVVVVNCAVAQTEKEAAKAWREDRLRRGVSPEREQSYRLPALEHQIDVVMRLRATSIRAYEPLMVAVRLTNRDTVPLELEVREDGLPHGTASVVIQPDGSIVRHDQWPVEHYETSPAARHLVLAPGESTTGEMLIVHGGPPTGVAFPLAGAYTVACACQPDGRFAPIMSNTTRITVGKLTDEERSFFSELRVLSLSYYGLDEDYLVEKEGEDVRKYEFGIRLVRRLLRHTAPLLVDPDRNPADKKEGEFIDLLTNVLDQHPNSSYSGYVARFLGLVHVKTFEHEVSHGGAKSWGETKASPDLKEVTRLCQSEYEKALRYLTIASEADLWPRTTAAFHLARLHGMAEDWEKVSTVCEKLRTKYAEQNGAAVADELQSEMRKYREKIAAWKGSEESSDKD